MNKSNTKYVISFLSGFALILAGVIGWGVYKIESHEADTKTLQAQVGTQMAEESLLQTIRNTRATALSEIESFEKAVLKEKDLVSLIESLENKGRSLGLKIETTSIDKTESKGGEPDKIKIVVQGEGTWSANNLFLHAVESLPYRVMISDIAMNQDDKGWHTKVTFMLYVF